MVRAPVIPERRILTPELQKKIEDRIRECLDIAQKVYPKHAKKFAKLPTIMYNIKNTFGGLAYTGGDMDYTIRLNLIFCFENEAEFIKQTVGHEAAHLICDRVFGTFKEVDGKRVKIRPHGTEWKEVMKHLGLVPHRTHVYDITSLDLQPKKRRKRGAVITATESFAMIKRLQNGFHRLPESAKKDFMAWMVIEGVNFI